MNLKISISIVLSVILSGVYPISYANEVFHERSYAVLSVVGDEISGAGYSGATGSRLREVHNQKQIKITIETSELDDAAVMAISPIIRKYQPSAKIQLLSTDEASLYQLQNRIFEADKDSQKGRDYLKSILAPRQVSHLIIVTKHRSDAMLKLKDMTFGHGKIEGLGFYVDQGINTVNTETLQSGNGILASYAYLKIRLVDAHTLKVIKEVVRTESAVHGNDSAKAVGISAWYALTGAEKIAALKNLLHSAMHYAIPELLDVPSTAPTNNS
jgi:hypothetical protein